MNIAGLTIEIWEMILIVALVLTISIFSSNFQNADSSQAEIYTNQINYIGYLIENKNVKSEVLVNDKTKIKELENHYQIEVNKKISQKLISKDLLKLKIEKSKLIITN